MTNSLNQALSGALNLEAVKDEIGIDLNNVSQGVKNEAMDVMLREHARLRQELHDHASIIGEMEQAGQRASEQEYGVFLDDELQARDFWCIEQARAALEECVPHDQWGRMAVRPIGTRTKASRAIAQRVEVYQAIKQDYDTTGKTIEALQSK